VELTGLGKSSDVDFEERDMQTLMESLFDIKADVKRILRLLEEEDGEEEEEEDT
jgi:hypothetical protein